MKKAKQTKQTEGLKRGNPGNKGGGRPPSWLKDRCAEIFEREELEIFLLEVAKGKDIEQGVGSEGEVIKIPASVKDRLKATEMLKDWGFGKEESKHSVEVSFVYEFVLKLTGALNKTLPEKCPHCQHSLDARERMIQEIENLSQSVEAKVA